MKTIGTVCLKVVDVIGKICEYICAALAMIITLLVFIKRNAVGVANAFISADMALAGIKSFIPPDEVLDALLDVEQRLPPELKCATIGGLACTRTAKCVRERLASGCGNCKE